MSNIAQFKKLFLYILIGALIASAAVAVITVLAGNFNETAAKTFLTLFMVILHSLVSLGFIWDNERTNTFERLAFFTNVIFMIIVLSFSVSLLGIWHIMTATTVWKFYQTFFVIAFAALHIDILFKATGKQTYLDKIITVNFVFIFIVFLMLLPVIFVNNSVRVLGDAYFRFLGAMSIIDGTLSIMTIIFYKLYLQQHPQELKPILDNGSGTTVPSKKGLNIWVWILIIYLVSLIGFPVFSWFTRTLIR